MNRFIAIATTIWLTTLGSAVTHAQESDTAAAPGRAMFLIVDYARIAEDATALKNLYAELEEARSRQAAAHNLTLDQLEETFAPYRLNRDQVSDEDYAQALKAFNDATAQMELSLSEIEAELNAAADAALARFDRVRQDVEAEIVAEYRVTRLLDRPAALYIRPESGYDVTDEIIQRIDERLPALELPKPDPEIPAAN
ncbi:MAG: hypothetical protein ACE363_09525 [Alphaproteobacteria bacterium]